MPTPTPVRDGECTQAIESNGLAGVRERQQRAVHAHDESAGRGVKAKASAVALAMENQLLTVYKKDS